MIALIANWKRILYGIAQPCLARCFLSRPPALRLPFFDGLKAENTELRETLAKVEQAQKLATKLAIEEKARIEAENKRKAEHAKLDYQKRLAANDAALRNWLQNNRRATGKPICPVQAKPPAELLTPVPLPTFLQPTLSSPSQT
ncbi:MAG: hypothetical protein IPM41_15935 [Sphingomonadales bacterium]|nr:hypothetical protein [Sphingomonadales bacterium]